MRIIAFEVPGVPVSWKVFTRYDDSVAKASLKAYQEHIRIVARAARQGLPPHGGAVHLTIEFWFQIPSELDMKKKQPHIRKRWAEEPWTMTPDSTNCFKGAEDALQGEMFLNDRQVIRGQHAKHHWGKEGKTEITVKFL